MNKVLLFYIIFFQVHFSYSQNIDSVIIMTERSASDSHGMEFQGAYVDSFSNGRLIDSVRFDTNWNPDFMYSDSFDVNGNLVQHDYINWTPNLNYYIHQTYTYNAQNLVVDFENLQGPPLYTGVKEHRTYDLSNKLIQSDFYKLINGNYSIDYKIEYSYDVLDSLQSTEMYAWKGGVWMLTEKHGFNFSPSYRNDTTVLLDTIHGILKYTSLKSIFTYNNLDTLILIQNFNPVTLAWDSSTKETWEYSPQSVLLTYMTSGYAGGWTMFDGSGYGYDSLGRLIQIHNLIADICHDDEYLNYDSNGNLNQYTYDHACPSQGSYTLERTYVYSGGQFSIFIPGNIDMCSNDSIEMHSVNISNNPNLHFQWTPSTGLSNDTIINPYVFVDSSTVYTVVVSDNIGNSDTLQTFVTVKNAANFHIVVSLIDTAAPCFSFRLGINTGSPNPANFTWLHNNADLFTSGTGELTDNRNGVFYLTCVANNGCVSEDSIDINFMPHDSVPPINRFVCNDKMFINYPNGISYDWFYDGHILALNNNDTITPMPSFSTWEDHTFYVVIEDSQHCEHFSEPIHFHTKENYFTSTPESCNGNCNGNAKFSLDPTYSPYTLIWLNGDTTFCTQCDNQIHPGHCEGFDSVLTIDREGCAQRELFSINGSGRTFSVQTQLVPDPLSNCNGSITIQTLRSDTSSSVYICVNDSNCLWFHSDTTLQNLCWGTYFITLYNQGCIYTDSIVIDSIATAVNQLYNFENYHLAPNPFSDKTYLFMNNFEKSIIEIYDLTGKKSRTIEAESNVQIIEKAGLADGVYILTVRNSERVLYRQKLSIIGGN